MDNAIEKSFELSGHNSGQLYQAIREVYSSKALESKYGRHIEIKVPDHKAIN